MMSTRSTLPMLAGFVLVLLIDTPRSAAQADQYNATPNTPPPSPSTQEPPGPTVKLEVWNASRYPATDFRSEVTPPMFALWPENLSYVKFEYYCEDTSNHSHRLKDFVYKEGQGILVTRPYSDVDVVDRDYTPYFQHWQFWQVDIKRITCVLHCEYSDLQRLYWFRLSRKVWGDRTGLWYGRLGHPTSCSDSAHSTLVEVRTTGATTNLYLENLEIGDAMERYWIHLLLLVVIGFAMMEGVGHSDYFRWRSMLLYNVAVTYTYLTLLSMISSLLHQCAHFLPRPRIRDPAPDPGPCRAPDLALQRSTRGLSEDWRYQRIFGQFGVLVLMGMYLIGVDDDEGQGMDSLGGIVVACIWSAGVSAVVAARSVRDIFKREALAPP